MSADLGKKKKKNKKKLHKALAEIRPSTGADSVNLQHASELLVTSISMST